jgi:prefoldin subunit 5
METPNNVHNLIPKDKHVGRIEDPYIAPEADTSNEALSRAAEEVLKQPLSKREQYGIENIEQVLQQLEAQESSFTRAINDLSEGNTKDVDLLKETRKVLLDLRQIVVELSTAADGGTATAENAAAVKTINERIAELDKTTKEVEENRAKLA